MAESVTNSDVPSVKPPPKRRRILDPSAIIPVPVYSSKVSSSLQLKPMAPVFTETETKGDDADDISSWSQFSSRGTSTTPPPPVVVGISDSDEDEVEQKRAEPNKADAVRCPSPPPPESPVQKQSRHVKRKISEIDRRLRAVSSLLSPEHQDRTGSESRRLGGDDDDDDDVIIMTPGPGSRSSPYSSSAREIPLKIRCRADIHKIPVLPSTPLSDVLAQLSVTLEVPPPRLLLLREDEELQTDATVGELGLGIADIIECVVMAAEEKNTGGDSGGNTGGVSGDIITVRLQSKDRDSSQEFSLHRDAPLGSVFSQYLSRMSPCARGKVRFHFDGSKVSERQTPAELDMEHGDIVEVWT